ncbi:hypothetical protein RIF29_20000 [Crotalaria pallida]|uniref:Uncharacterized protein n=1 Tax=Crotalaria pallida TaxID=3830 RepID=A0AAN9F3Q0_CROPI
MWSSATAVLATVCSLRSPAIALSATLCSPIPFGSHPLVLLSLSLRSPLTRVSLSSLRHDFCSRQDLAAVGSGGNESSFLIASEFEPSEDRSKDRKVVVGAMASIPCGVCPRIRVCTPNGIVNPTNCLHYQNWYDEYYQTPRVWLTGYDEVNGKATIINIHRIHI